MLLGIRIIVVLGEGGGNTERSIKKLLGCL